MNYDEREVLLQIKRQYSKDELLQSVCDMLNRERELSRRMAVQVMAMGSEISSLRSKFNELVDEYDTYTQDLRNQIARHRNKKNYYKRQMIEWRNKYHSKLNENENQGRGGH